MVLLVIMHLLLVLCSLLLLLGSRCSTSWPVRTRRTVTWYFLVMAQRPFPIVQTVLRTLEIPQLQFHRCTSWRRWLTCPLCATSGAGRDCALNCGGFRSCSPSASWSDVCRFSQWKSGFHEPLVSGSHCVHARQLRRLLEEFHFLREGVLDLRSILVLPGVVRTRKSGHYPCELPVDV